MPAFTKECKLCSHMNHFNSQKCKQCHTQLAIGGKPTAKKGKKCKVCGNTVVAENFRGSKISWNSISKKFVGKNRGSSWHDHTPLVEQMQTQLASAS